MNDFVDAPDRGPYYPAIDGVRAWCVLLVMFDHLKADGHTVSWINGHLGVDVFFIISGFLITSLLRREETATGRVDLGAFYWRRVFRIVPVYLVVLGLYVAVCQLPSQREHWVQLKAGLPWFLTLMNEYAREPGHGSVFLHTWSLGVEEKFYLLWPVLFFVLMRTARLRVILFALLFAAVSLAPFAGGGYLARAYFGLLMGCLMAEGLSGSYRERILQLLRALPAWVVTGLLVVGFWLEHLSKSLIFFFSLFAVLFLAFLIARESWLSRVHSSRVMVWLGKRSYSMYLIHVLCLNVFETRVKINSGWMAAGVLAAAYGLAAVGGEVLHRGVEEPMRAVGKRYLVRRSLSRTSAIETA